VCYLLVYNTCVGFIDHRYDAEFRRQRKLSLSILKEFGFGKDIMEERIQVEVSLLLQQIRDIKSAAFCPETLLTSGILNVIASILFGHRVEAEGVCELNAVIHGFLRSTFDLLPVDVFPLLRFLPKMRRSLAVSAAFNNHLFRIITRTIEASDEDSFVRYYMNREGSKLDREQLEFIVRDLVLAGTETITSTLLWAIVLLAGRNGQSVQERMWKEIDSQVPRDRLPSLDDRSHLPIVDATILEVMRIRTAVPLALAHWTSRDTTVGGYFIPANTLASNSTGLFLIRLHRHSLSSLSFLPARRYASAVFATATCLSVCHTPVCLAERKQDREMYTF